MMFTRINVGDSPQAQSLGFKTVQLSSFDDSSTELAGGTITPNPNFSG
jgi:hypothetical protein